MPPAVSHGFDGLLDVPPELARIVDAHFVSPLISIPDYILIQDVHRHPKVQNQIAVLIEYAYDRWGVRKVFLEGAFSALDMSVFHRVPSKTQQLLMAHLVKDGNLSGPELAAVQIMEREWRNPPASPFQLFGIDEPELYRQNVQAYHSVVTQRDRALEQLLTIRRIQDSMHLPEPNRLNEQLDRTESLLRLKLTPAEYDAYLRDRETIPSTPIIDPAIHAAEDFYRFAQLRSQVFLKRAAQMVPASTAPRILVIGGFHTPYMASLLRKEGRSFVVLSPHVTANEDDPIYEKRLRETANVLAQALSLNSR